MPLDGSAPSQVASVKGGSYRPNVFSRVGVDDGALYTTIDWTTGTLWHAGTQ